MGKLYDWIDRVWQWVSETLFVRFQFDFPLESLRQANRDGRVVFMLAHGGVLEWLILSSWCRSQGLGAILITNRRRILLLSKPGFFFQVVFGRRTFDDLFLEAGESGPRLLFTPSHERKRLFDPTPGEKLLSALYSRSQAAGRIGFFTFVPVLILWRRHVRGGSRAPSEYLLGLSSNPNWIGKFWYLLRRRMDSTVRALETFSFVTKEPAEGSDLLGESEAMRIAKAVRRRTLVRINQEMRVVLGPVYASPYAVKETLIRDPELQAVIEEVAKAEGVEKRKVMARAYQNFTEMAGNYRYRFIEVMYVFLTWLFNRVFEGVIARDEEIQHVRDTMKNKVVVFVPCHRSHLDYLVIPYVLFQNNIVTPYIAAGINLAFWPVGYFLRLGGAFFIRRSFRGDKLYSLSLKKYVTHLLKNRYNIMFFIEGTRSRSGKMLAPAYGILKMTFESVQRHEVEDIAYYPVALCYDEVPEQGAYSKELAGGQKTKESARELLKSRKIVRRKFGKVYVRLAKPIFARDLIEKDVDDTLMLQKTAFQLCKGINDVTPITPKSLVCTVFLSHIISSVSLEEVLRLAQMLGQYVLWSGSPLSVDLDSGFPRGIEQTVKSLQKTGVLQVSETVPRTYYCENRRRILLNFYKNNAIHCLVTPSILLLSFFHALRAKSDAPLIDEARKTAVWLRNALKFEFFFSPTEQYLDELRRNIEFFFGPPESRGTLREDFIRALSRKFEHWNDVSVYLRLLGELLESYHLVALFLLESVGTQTHEKKALAQKVAKFAEMRDQAGGIYFPESISVQNYSNALMLFENMKLITMKKEADKTFYEYEGNHAPLLVEFEKTIAELLALMQEKPENIVNPEKELFVNA